MIVKFHNHGTGSASGALNYLLKEKMERMPENKDQKRLPLQLRAYARVLSGDPVVTEQLINTTRYKQKYKSGVLSFEKRANELTEEEKFEIMQKFEDVIFCGLERDQFDILWIEHADKDINENNPVGRLELNFLIAGQELRSGKRLQPFYAGADLVRVNAFKDVINHEYKLADPNDPKRKRLTNPYSDNWSPPTPYDMNNYSRKEAKKDEEVIADPPDRIALRDAINRRIKFAYQQKLLMNRYSVKLMLIEWGLEIERDKSKNSLSVSNKNIVDKNGKPLHIRLTGDIYKLDFDANKNQSLVLDLDQKAHNSRAHKDYDIAKQTLAKGIEIKEKYHTELYADAELPEPLKLNIIDVKVDNTAKQPNIEPEQPEQSPNQTSLDFYY